MGVEKDSGGRGPEGEGRGRRTSLWVRAAQLGATVLVTWFILDRVGLSLEEVSRLDPARWRPRWGVLGLASGALLGGYLISAILWGRMVRELGGPRVGVLDACRVYFTANLGRYVPGKVLQIAGVAYLSRGVGVSPALGTASAVLGQGLALAGATLVGALALLGSGQRFRTLGVVAIVGAALLVVLVGVPAVFRRGVDLWFRLARGDPPDALEADATFGLRWLALYTVNWVVYAGSFWGLVRSFGLEGGALEVASAFAAAYVLGYVAFFAPAGLGVREGFLVAFLTPILGPAGPGGAAAVAVIARLWTTLVELVPAAGFAASYLGIGAARAPRDGIEGGEG